MRINNNDKSSNKNDKKKISKCLCKFLEYWKSPRSNVVVCMFLFHQRYSLIPKFIIKIEEISQEWRKSFLHHVWEWWKHSFDFIIYVPPLALTFGSIPLHQLLGTLAHHLSWQISTFLAWVFLQHLWSFSFHSFLSPEANEIRLKVRDFN